MPVTALLLVLAAAVVHATWNLLLSGAEDTHAATAVAVVVGVVAFAPVAALSWDLRASALPYIAVSSVLELIYLALLATGYARAEMSFVYPIARGSAPVFVLVVSVVALGAGISALGVVGVLLIAGGIVLVRGLTNSGRPRDLALALAVGGCIASYTLVDKHGIVHSAPITYLELVFAATAVGYLIPTWRSRGARALQAAITWPTLVAGAGFFASYALTLAALSLASAASVAAVRETSVVIAAAVLAVSGRERPRIERIIGSVAVVGGIACIAFG
jgi:drug/metabolite transporter (DMT)-like permease